MMRGINPMTNSELYRIVWRFAGITPYPPRVHLASNIDEGQRTLCYRPIPGYHETDELFYLPLDDERSPTILSGERCPRCYERAARLLKVSENKQVAP